MHVVLSPALPSELLAYIVAHCVYPTTLVVCASSDEFVRVCVEEGEGDATDGSGDSDGNDGNDGDDGNGGDDDGDRSRGDKKDDHDRTNPSRWASVSLLQVAVARHIRVAFVPTVAHLRAFLAAFEPAAGPVAPPPSPMASSNPPAPPPPPPPPPPRPALLVYGFVALHHDTSEWSAQGVGTSAAVLVEAAWQAGWNAVLVEGRKGRAGGTAAANPWNPWDDAFPAQTLPVLSTVPRRQLQRAGYPPRTRSVRSVLGQRFRFRLGPWEKQAEEGGEPDGGPEEPRAEPLPENKGPSDRPAARAYVKDSEDEDEEDEHENDKPA